MAWLVPLKQKSEKAKSEARARAGASGSAFIDNDDAGVVRLSREHSSNPHPCQEPVLHWLIIPIWMWEVATESCSELVRRARASLPLRVLLPMPQFHKADRNVTGRCDAGLFFGFIGFGGGLGELLVQ